MVKVTKTWAGKKSPTNPDKKEQHLNRKTKEELEYRWQNDDWKKQLQEYLDGNNFRILSKE